MAPQGAQYNNAPQQPYGMQGTQQDMRAPGNPQQRGEQEGQQPQRGSGGGDQNEPTLGSNGANTGRFATNENGRGSDAGRFGPNGNGGGAGPNGTNGALGGAGINGGAVNGGSGNPDDDAPAQDPGSPLFKGHVKRGTESGLMLYQDLATTNGANLPELRLDMHVYDPKPQARFALINMRKVTEGQMAGEGVRVEAITPEGVVLSHNGTKFLLPRE